MLNRLSMEEINFVEEINLGEIPFDVDFHPSDNLVATALINGDIHLYRFSPDTVPKRKLDVHAHRDSCRAVRFIDCGRGNAVYLILDVVRYTTGVNTTSPAINRLINLTEFTVASGDDDGFIKVWDIRTRSCCNNFYAHEKYISDMTFASDAMKLLSTSLMKIPLLLGSENGIIKSVFAFSHDRKFLGSIGYDKKLKLWDLDSILPVKRFIQRCTQEFVSENHAVNPP
ncbi:hypothetical protein ACSQ67_009735 [Phaseolus vulgaris]